MDRLFFIFMPGCATCAAMKPILQRFRDSRPDVRVIPLDITAVEWRASRWSPEVTPTLVKLDRYGRYKVFDGRPDSTGGRIVDAEEMQQWLSQNF